MTRILGLTSIFEYSNSPEETHDIIQKLKFSAGELDQVIKDLTMMTVIRNVNRSTFREVDLNRVVNTVLTRHELRSRESLAALEIDLAVSKIYTSEDYIENILLTLVDNAITYRSPSRLPVIGIKSGSNDDQFWIEVYDNGIGIDLNQFGGQLFVPYRRFHFETKGKGLGLYTVKTQVEAIGGTIEVFSKLNEGTSFRMFFKTSVT